MLRFTSLTAILLVSGCASRSPSVKSPAQEVVVPISSPLATDSAGKQAEAAKQGVVRILCRSTGMGGTGFLHKSGVVITAAHVVADCPAKDLMIINSSARIVGVTSTASDTAKDLALLRPVTSLGGMPLTLSHNVTPIIGEQIATWGFPGGYDGSTPLLSVGYLAGVQDFVSPSGATTRRWVVNAAFNGGNSGGPILSVDDGRVVGVVSSKLAPLPPALAQVLAVLGEQKYGMQYSVTRPDGSTDSVSEAQLVAELLKYLRSQVQLVIGYSVAAPDVSAFLEANDIAP